MLLCNRHLVVVLRYPCLVTWALWHHLLHPPAHPVYQRTLRTPIDSGMRRFIAGIVLLFGSLICSGIWTLVPLKLPTPMLLLIAMVALSSCYVVAWVIGISVTITSEHERGTYDQLCVSPSGALGANWAMCAASLHRADALVWIDLLRRLLSGLLLLILLMVLLTSALRENAPDLFQLLGLVVDILLLATLLYVEHVQSVVQGSLVGMLMSMYSRTNIDARVLAVLMFLFLQAVTLLVTFFATMGVLPGLDAEFISTTLILLVFYLTREGFIFAFWRLLAYRWIPELLS